MNDDEIILRATDENGVSHEVGMFSRTPKKRNLPTPAQTPEPKRHTPKEAAKKIARTVIESTVQVTEEQALAKAAEYASEAAVRMSHGTPRKKGRGLLHFISNGFGKKGGNG